MSWVSQKSFNDSIIDLNSDKAEDLLTESKRIV